MIAQSNSSVTSCRAGLFLLLFSCGLVSGCDQSEIMGLEDYRQRLARSLDMTNPGSQAAQTLRLPAKREIQIRFSAAGLDILEFLSIGNCELQAVVAAGNSSLGRLAEPSQRLIYELDFLRVANDCIDVLNEDSPDLADKLQRAVILKRSELPSRIWTATLGGKEFRQFWSNRQRSIQVDAELHDTFRSLAGDIDRWLVGDYMIAGDFLEQRLQLISQGSGGGLMQNWNLIDSSLRPATELVLARTANRPLCFEAMESETAAIFRRVVMGYFVEGVQREIAVLNRSTFEVIEAIERLENRLEAAEPSAYSTWRTQRNLVIKTGRESVTEHVAALAPLMNQCGFMPGSQ
jgi:hypothetical protein